MPDVAERFGQRILPVLAARKAQMGGQSDDQQNITYPIATSADLI
jgi:hypothetical protein